jgi:DNA-binding NarL/FixJ family response regulator
LRVLIAENHEIVRAILVALLSPDFQVIGAVGDGEQLIQAAFFLQPDVIISAISMPLLDGFSAKNELRSRGMEYPFVFVTTMDLPGLVRSMEQGPVGYVHSADLFNELKLAIDTVSLGISYISRSIL